MSDIYSKSEHNIQAMESKNIYLKSEKSNQTVEVSLQDSVKPINKQVFVCEIQKSKQTTKSNLILTTVNQVEVKYAVGRVMAVAEDVEGIKVGDIVMYKHGWAPIEFKVENTKYSFLKSEDISAILLTETNF